MNPPSLAASALLAAALVATSLGAQAPPFPGAVTRLRDLAARCDTVATLRGVPGGGEFRLSGDEPLRVPYGVRFEFRRRVPDASVVLLTLDVESEGDLPEPRQTVRAERAALDTTCFTAMLPKLPQDRGVTLTQSGVAPLPPARRAAMRDAVQNLLASFLDSLFAGTFARAAAAQRLDSAFAAVYPRLAPDSAFAGAALVRVNGGTDITPLADTIRALFLAGAELAVDLPEIVREGAEVLGDLRAALSGPPCVATRAGADLTRFRALVARLGPLAAVARGADIAPLYRPGSGLLPLTAEDARDLVRFLDTACRGAMNQAALDDLATPILALARDPLGPLLAAVGAAQHLVEQSWTVTAVDAFGGATTTLQRYGQIDIVNAYVADRDEARVLVTFSFYPLKRRYGGERLPHEVGDQLLVSIGYSVATTTSDASSEPRAFTLGLTYRFNAALSVGGGVAVIDRRSYGYASFAFDVGSIPGLAGLFARPGT
jgi:hypothetical protein